MKTAKEMVFYLLTMNNDDYTEPHEYQKEHKIWNRS